MVLIILAMHAVRALALYLNKLIDKCIQLYPHCRIQLTGTYPGKYLIDRHLKQIRVMLLTQGLSSIALSTTVDQVQCKMIGPWATHVLSSSLSIILA
jgi:hypothetical protein